MARARLTDEERLARKKARAAFSFSSAAYKHYDPKTEGYGSFDEWVFQADSLLGSLGLNKPAKSEPQLVKDLRTLNLDALPELAADLKRAYRNTLFIVHPDHGGTNEATIEALKAFERLSRHYT